MDISQPMISNQGKAADWALYFENQILPIQPRSKEMLAELEAAKGERLAPKDLLPIVLQDSLLCLTLLRQAGMRKSRRLDHDTTTALAALLQLGVNGFKKLLTETPDIAEDEAGLVKVETRARYASELAQTWSKWRMDINPEEVAVAALLGGIGDILLWVYAPEIPLNVLDKLNSGEAKRSADAQRKSGGFSFKELSVECATRWGLSDLLVQLLKGSDSVRALMTRVCANTARHILDDSETSNTAIACDLIEANQLMRKADLTWLCDSLTMISAERRLAILEIAQDLNTQKAAEENDFLEEQDKVEEKDPSDA